jgi:hypothetical protein
MERPQRRLGKTNHPLHRKVNLRITHSPFAVPPRPTTRRHLDRSEAKWRDPRIRIGLCRCPLSPPHNPPSSRPKRSEVERPPHSHWPSPLPVLPAPQPAVISTGAKRSGETPPFALAFALARSPHPTTRRHLDRSEAKWRDPRIGLCRCPLSAHHCSQHGASLHHQNVFICASKLLDTLHIMKEADD